MKEAVKWNRREFTVAPNGYFNVLKSTGWLAAFRLPGGFRYRFGRVGTQRVRLDDLRDSRAADRSVDQQASISLPQVDGGRHSARDWLRLVLLMLAGIVLSFLLLFSLAL